MTEGTSQGLLIVVAIVIFGIFVALSYTLFAGELGLEGNMKTIFESALVPVQDLFTGVKSRQLIDLNTVNLDALLLGYTTEESGITLNKDMENKILTLDSEGYGFGLNIPTKDITKEKTFYILTFKMKLISGKVNSIGGHIGGVETLKGDGIKDVVIRINNEIVVPKDSSLSNNDWYTGVETPYVFAEGDELFVEVAFYRDFFSTWDYVGAPIKIQPNRDWSAPDFGYGEPYVVEISELSMLEMYSGIDEEESVVSD